MWVRPNRSFIRQLQEFEEILAARSSKSDTGGSGGSRKSGGIDRESDLRSRL